MLDSPKKQSLDYRKVIAIAFFAVLFFVLAYAYGTLTSFGQRRHDHEFLFKRQSQMIYHLASKRDFAGMEKLGFGSEKEFAELDRKFGRVQSWSIERVHVRLLGLPGYVVLKVKRNSDQLELLSFMSRGSATPSVVTKQELRAYGLPEVP